MEPLAKTFAEKRPEKEIQVLDILTSRKLADVNQRSPGQYSALDLAVIRKDEKMVEALLRLGADPTANESLP